METETKKKKFTDLKFERVTMPMVLNHIPRYLFEQVKGLSFDIDRFYKFSNGLISNKANLFFVLTDEDRIIKGVFWASLNVLGNCIDVILLSVDKEYQSTDGEEHKYSDILKETLKFVETFQKNATIRIMARKTAAYEKFGFKKVRTVMEMKNVN